MHRHFILHIGPTNSGKTFRSLERLKLAINGVYLGPLRLLALEVFEQMQNTMYPVPCGPVRNVSKKMEAGDGIHH